MVDDATIAAIVTVLVTASLPFYLKGAWIMIDAEVVSWNVLMRHLRYVVVGLVLTTVPMVVWMIPRVVIHLSGLTALHAFLGIQAYALLLFGLTGIVRIFQAKRRAELYRDPDPDVDISELGDRMDHWRMRLRVGVFGYVIFWFGAWLLGTYRFFLFYVL